MNVDLALFANLSQYQPDGRGGRNSRVLELANDATVGSVIETLGLPDAPRIIFVNGLHAEEERVLGEGDRLAIFPPIAGG